jgi:signal transduction histidine kinase
MNLPSFISLSSTILFGVIAIVCSVKEERTKKLLIEREELQKKRFYELTVLKQMHDRIGYSLDVERIIDVVSHSLDNLFPYSVVSTIIINNNKLIFKAQIKEPVSKVYIEKMKMNMMKFLTDITHTQLPNITDEHISGMALNHENIQSPQSYSNIPFIVKDNIVGIITLSSTKPNLYKQKEMTLMYQIIGAASYALTRLDDILTREKGKFKAMISDLSDGIFMIDTNNQINIINDAAKKFLNIEKEKPNILDIFTALPNTYDFSGKIQYCMTQNQPVDKDGLSINGRLFHMFIKPVHDETVPGKQKVIGASVLFQDITAEKSAEQMKEDFTNVIVHELRSPLTAIKASSDLLNATEEMSDEKRKTLTQLISIQSKKLLDEIKLILDAAKLEAGLFMLQKKRGDLKKLIQETISVYIPEAQEKGIDITTDVNPLLPEFSFDSNYIDQVLNNLLSNSLKFTSKGGSITIKAIQEQNNIIITVTDTGSGIPKDKQHLLFSKFTQIKSPGDQNGTGLGLYIVKGVVEAHGGTVALHSQEGKGTTVLFTLPINAPAQKKIYAEHKSEEMNSLNNLN